MTISKALNNISFRNLYICILGTKKKRKGFINFTKKILKKKRKKKAFIFTVILCDAIILKLIFYNRCLLNKQIFSWLITSSIYIPTVKSLILCYVIIECIFSCFFFNCKRDKQALTRINRSGWSKKYPNMIM